MDLDPDKFLQNLQKESETRATTLQKLWSAADSAKVFGQPVVSGAYTVITAAEVAGGGGLGSGMGFGKPPNKRAGVKSGDQDGAGDSTVPRGTGGGGGGSMGRPVAAIVIGPEGVDIKPILDVSKVALTAVAALSGIALFGLKVLKKRL